MIGKVIKLRNKDGDKLSARLVEIVDDEYLKLRFRNGMEAFITISNIIYIMPIKNQPLASEVI
jgi:hypothetical protein